MPTKSKHVFRRCKNKECGLPMMLLKEKIGRKLFVLCKTCAKNAKHKLISYQPKKSRTTKYVVEKLREDNPYDAGARRLKRCV